MAFWYIGSTKYTAVPTFQANHAYAVGDLLRPASASAGNERVYVVYQAGTSGGSTPSFVTSKGATGGNGTFLFREATGQAALNGDSANATPWTASTVRKQGDVIKNVSGGSDTYFICAGNGTTKSGAEPTWNKTPGATTTDNTTSWVSLGPIANYTTAWGAPHARVENAETPNWGGSGDTFFISNNHAQTGSSISVFQWGEPTAVCKYLCVDDGVVPPTTLATTATITGTSAAQFGDGYGYIYGVQCNAGTGSSSTSLTIRTRNGFFENCTFNLGTTHASSYMLIGNSNNLNANVLQNCNFTFGATGQKIALFGSQYGGYFTMQGGSIAATGSAPSTLFDRTSSTANNTPCIATFRDVDLSAITGTLCSIGVSASKNGAMTFENCKLGSGVTIHSGSFQTQSDSPFYFYNCDNGATNYKVNIDTMMGTVQSDTTTVRTGGAASSWKMISTAYSTFAIPLEVYEVSIWNEVIGASLTATVEIAGASALNTNDIWVEFEYPGSSGSPLGSLATSKGPYLGATALPTSSVTWGGSPASKQYMSVTFTPQMAGVIKARIYLAKPSTTVYVDPYITLNNNVSNRRQYLLPGFGNVNETAQGETSYAFVG